VKNKEYDVTVHVWLFSSIQTLHNKGFFAVFRNAATSMLLWMRCHVLVKWSFWALWAWYGKPK